MSSFRMHLQLMDGSIAASPTTNTSFKWTASPSMAKHERHQSEIKDGTFPVKLHTMLQKVQGTLYQELIDWDPNGMSFVIYKPKEFADQLMGMYFRQTKYKSFQRQLNFYGFTRSRRGIIRGVYSHPLFQRDQPDLCQRMRRMDATGNHNDSSFEASSSIRQHSAAVMQNCIPLPPSARSLMENSQQHPLLLNNMPNNFFSQVQRTQHDDDDSIETIDHLPLLGYTPCFLTDDDPF